MKLLESQLPTKTQIEAEIYKRSLYKFVLGAWSIIQEGYEYQDNWHIETICRYLEKTQDFESPDRIKNLMIGLPPRCMKSLLVAVFFPAWLWAKKSNKRFMYVTSTEELASDSTGLVKKLVNSDWYQERFNVRLTIQQSTKLVTSSGGVYQGYGIQSAITGKGSDICLLDDVISATNAASQVELDKVNRIYDETISSRLNSQKKGTRVLIQQRLSTGDLTGHLLEKEKDKWTQLVIPMIFDTTRYTCPFDPSLNDFRQPGDLLWPERFDQQIIDELKVTLGERAFWSQYQQLPSPKTGSYFLRKWVQDKRVDNTSVAMRVISIDTAIVEDGDYSVILVGEITADNHLFLRYCWRDKVKLPDLKNKVVEIANKYKYGLVKILVESKASGWPLIQTIEAGNEDWIIEKLEPINPTVSKDVRAAQASVWMENGSILFPTHTENYPWLNIFEDEIFSYAGEGSTKNDDQVDTFSQLVLYCEYVLEDGLRERLKGGIN